MDRLFIITNDKVNEYDTFTFFDATAIYNNTFCYVVFASKGGKHYVYLVNELCTRTSYRNIFGSKRYGKRGVGYEVYAKKEVSKEVGNAYWMELKKNIFKSKNLRKFVRISEF